MATLKIKSLSLMRICPKTDSVATFFLKSAFITNVTFTMWKWYQLFNFTELIDENQVHIAKVRFAVEALLEKKVDKLTVIQQKLIKAQHFIFRDAIFMVISIIWNWMWTLKIKVMPDSWSVCLKTPNSEICFSGFPKNACQGCHISEGAR